MIISLPEILTAQQLETINDRLNNSAFTSGVKTAGWYAKTIKNNLQLDPKTNDYDSLKKLVKNQLFNHPLIKSACFPKIIHSLLFSRYEEGMYYGRHVDNAMMGSNHFWRSDISFTLFLNSPTSYQGGELIIEGVQKEESYKLSAGSIIIYPSYRLHRVEKVTQGIRFVVVGWIQSLIRDSYKREILFELDTIKRSLFAQYGKTDEFDLLSKNHANLIRLWVEN
jgi:PKHD-type hydroxylase